MNYTGVVGFLVGMALVIGAIILGVEKVPLTPFEGAVALFVNIPSFMIVLGGSLAASMIAFQSNTLGIVLRSIGNVLTRKPPNFVAMKRTIVRLARRAPMADPDEMEKAIESIKNPFLRDGMQMFIDGFEVEEIEDVLGQRIEYRLRKERIDTDVIRTIARFCPAFGMIGTLIGLINMLAGMGEGGDAMSRIGADMAVALVTTFYGLFAAYLVFIPIAVKLESRTEEEVYLMQMISESIRMLVERWSPDKVEDYLNSFVAPEQRKRVKDE